MSYDPMLTFETAMHRMTVAEERYEMMYRRWRERSAQMADMQTEMSTLRRQLADAHRQLWEATHGAGR